MRRLLAVLALSAIGGAQHAGATTVAIPGLRKLFEEINRNAHGGDGRQLASGCPALCEVGGGTSARLDPPRHSANQTNRHPLVHVRAAPRTTGATMTCDALDDIVGQDDTMCDFPDLSGATFTQATAAEAFDEGVSSLTLVDPTTPAAQVIVVGQAVSGAGLADGTTVASYDTATKALGLSDPTTALMPVSTVLTFTEKLPPYWMHG